MFFFVLYVGPSEVGEVFELHILKLGLVACVECFDFYAPNVSKFRAETQTKRIKIFTIV